ncbi:MAG: hypothetical protein R3B67_08755 [Phycisphaerales bacterium]
MSKKPTPDKPAYIRDVLSNNFREANHSYTLLRKLFYENGKDIPYTTNLFDGETVFVLHQALFSSMISSLGRLMDTDKKSASIPKAISIIRAYKPSGEHIDGLWRYNLDNWRYDFEERDVVLQEPSEKQRKEITEAFLKTIPLIEQKFEELEVKYEPIRKWRNKQVAHSDIAHNDGRKEIEGIPPKDLCECMDSFRHIVELICGHLFQATIDTSSRWAEHAANQIIDYAYTDQLARIMINYISRHSKNPSKDKEIFLASYADRWSTPEGKELLARVLAKRELIRERILKDQGIVTSTDIDEG